MPQPKTTELELKRIVFQSEVVQRLFERDGMAGLGEYFSTMLKVSMKEFGFAPSEWVLISKPEFDKLTNALGNVKEVNKSVGG